MDVYLHGEVAKSHPNYQVRIAPAADTGFVGTEIPASWKEADGSPKQIDVMFAYGHAVVPDDIGHYMVRRGIAKRHKLIEAARGLVGLS